VCSALPRFLNLVFVGYVVFWRHNPNLFRQIEALFKALYVQNILLLVLVETVFLALFAFYIHARTYQNRYKFVVTVNVLTLIFLRAWRRRT
jgi:hypothetical protein